MRNFPPSSPSSGLSPLSLAALLCLSVTSHESSAQASPYYVGVSQTLQHESNLLRLRDGQAAPAGSSESDTISNTALVAGVDQRFGRQRLNGSVSLRSNHYNKNRDFNGEGYSFNLGLDWETIESLSGTVTLGADRNPRADVRDRFGRFISGGNTETTRRLGATASLGVAGPLALEVGVSRSELNYSSSAASYAEYDQTGASAGLRYRLGGATSVALTLRQSNVNYPGLLVGQANPSDKRKRNDIELSGVWVPSGASRLDARLSQGKTKYEQLSQRDFSGAAGSLSWTWQPSGKLRLTTRLGRDAGQNSDLATTAFSQTTDTLRVSADYELSGKITATASAQATRRQLDGSGQLVAGVQGNDTGSNFSLGARWAVLRSATLGCQTSFEKRGSNSSLALNEPYSANVFSCFGQLVLQ